MNLGEQVKKLKLTFLQKVPDDLEKAEAEAASAAAAAKAKAGADVSESSNSLIQALVGELGAEEGFYFPSDLIGGTCPRIAGDEEEIVWNAAAEACDTERVHVVWRSFASRIWYLAIRSSDLASHTNTWCPLAALLPTEKDKLPICYTYFGEEIAVLMVVTPDGLNIFRGTAPVVRAKAERTARELENAPIVNLDPFRIEQLPVAPWYSVSLFEDRARRALATISVLASLTIMAISFLVWITASMAAIAARHNLADALDRTQTKSMQLLRDAEGLRSSPMREQIERFLNVNDALLSLNGFLNVYEIKDNVVRWRAVVPTSATAERISAIGGKNIETTDHGVTIGNDAEIKYEESRKK